MNLPGSDIVNKVTGSQKKKQDAPSFGIYEDADYQPILGNWYTARPYGFKYTPRGKNEPIVMYLPISPSNLTITTDFATVVTPTLYGTVEEHSPVRYYDISIEGTTGIGPRYAQPFMGEPVKAGGRTTFTVQQAIKTDIAGGLFSKTLQAAQNVYNKTVDLLGGGPTPITGLQLDQTGYMAFHNLYRFLLKYKKDASGVDRDKNPDERGKDSHPLIFFNYKDNNQYKVVVRAMTLRRDNEDPMMYRYSISMRGYDLTEAGSSADGGKADDKMNQLLEELGLANVKGTTLLGDIKEKANQAKDVLASVGAGINQLGR